MEGYFKNSYLSLNPHCMPKSGPIIIIEDDPDEEGIMEEVIKELNFTNKLVYFNNGTDAFQYLATTRDQPFIIFCDINLPEQSGIEFKKKIDEHKELKKKSIPFVFYSTSVSLSAVNEAYTQMTIQGFFKKENSYEEIKKSIGVIFDYWELCQHPNS
jgi:response regulator RpfG family c-di-GMP phosphodiesterase